MILIGQFTEQLWRAWLYVTHTRSLAMFLGIGFAILAIVLLIASRTRWGQAKPLTKAVALSVLAHVWLLMYVLGTRVILPQGDPAGRETNMSVAFESQALDHAPSLLAQPTDDESLTEFDANLDQLGEPEPWERSAQLAELPRPTILREALNRTTISAPNLLSVREATPMPDLEPVVESTPGNSSPSEESIVNSAAELETPGVSVTEPVLPPVAMTSLQNATVDWMNQSNPVNPPSAEPTSIPPPATQLPRTQPQIARTTSMPTEYQLRQAPNRLQLATAYGADADSEAAVHAGLQWLAEAQSSDGSWNAKKYGAGTETFALGESRYGTGDKADTGISGLALLAFLSAGHTHLEGEYRTTVQHGLQYLLRAQMPSGDLSGPLQVGNDRSVLNARMYCHSIATLALAEAHAMTGDALLRDSLLRAAQYSISAQDPRGGGWRYRPLDAGDLSQFGWQAMALKSVARSGIPIPAEVQARMRRFLDSCAAGEAGGLARYQPKNRLPSETMTAEAFACRLLLDYPITPAAKNEALAMIMKNRPGVGQENVYFWYYATLALFQLQDQNWRDWNQSLKQQLLTTQIPAYGDHPGSWNPDKMWGGYGGRVYSTAMSCLCLEVYYRYLPMYQSNRR